jgi:hypothetical protein
MVGDFKFNLLCTPAKVYFAIAVIASIIALFNGVHLMAVLMKLVFAFVWTFLLGMLCRKGFKTLAWFLVALPYIFLLLAMFGIYHATRERQLMRSVQMQGVYGQEAMTPMPSTMPSVQSLQTQVQDSEDPKKKR